MSLPQRAWGIAQALGTSAIQPRLLIATSDGYIHAFICHGKFEAHSGPTGYPLWIDGCGGLASGNNTNSGLDRTVFHSGAPTRKNDGILGKITANGSEQRAL